VFLKNVFDEMRSQGMICHYGKWQIHSDPAVILIDFKNCFEKKNGIKTKLWEAFKVDSLGSSYDFDEPTVWAWCAGMLLKRIGDVLHDKKIIAHFHEWLTGAGMLYLKTEKSHIRTVFTTHATMLGRALADSGFELYKELGKFDPMQKAKDYNILAKHTTEVACANNANVFTTVSEITSLETEKLLGRKADVLLLNGIDVESFPTIEETSIKHVT
jgi:phosphorylase/glycogen(starch) synthase